MNEDQQHFVEDFGLALEQAGLPRMTGRVWGYLLISDPPHQSAESLAKALQASRGSISMTTRSLMQMGLIDKVSFPGERRDYFRIRPGVWADLLEQRARIVSDWRRLAERGLAVMDSEDAEARRRLQEMRDIMAFYERELPALTERWRKEEMKGSA
ncbi:MAG: MarR family transcriptional regulator [Actinomycetota bacterium]|nr:MarR family transcriptional regulator [Actinomycetota bacterium]HZY65797.1 MarR family transcriptional regulator [Rubrobacteraceae bacterium]